MLPFPKSTTPKDPEPRKVAPWFDGTLEATAFTGTAGGGIWGMIAVPMDDGGMYSYRKQIKSLF